MWWVEVGGENQIDWIAQVQVLKILFKSLSSHDSDVRPDSDHPDPHLTFTWPGPGPELDKNYWVCFNIWIDIEDLYPVLQVFSFIMDRSLWSLYI